MAAGAGRWAGPAAMGRSWRRRRRRLRDGTGGGPSALGRRVPRVPGVLGPGHDAAAAVVADPLGQPAADGRPEGGVGGRLAQRRPHRRQQDHDHDGRIVVFGWRPTGVGRSRMLCLRSARRSRRVGLDTAWAWRGVPPGRGDAGVDSTTGRPEAPTIGVVLVVDSGAGHGASGTSFLVVDGASGRVTRRGGAASGRFPCPLQLSHPLADRQPGSSASHLGRCRRPPGVGRQPSVPEDGRVTAIVRSDH